jgi:hypothetical protein
VDEHLSNGHLRPDPPVQLKPVFEQGKTVEELADDGILDDLCRRIFCFRAASEPAGPAGRTTQLQPDLHTVITECKYS